jgi:glycosyltransferase involved in cell wall biosynthesis
MAFGRPVIASRVGGLVEVVEDGNTGWLVPPDRPGVLADLLCRIVERPAAWYTFAEAARRRYLMLFSDEAVTASMIAVVKT